MKNHIRNCLLSLLATIITFNTSFGQERQINEKIDNWFLEQRFILADKNDDALLDKKEMDNFGSEFVYFLNDRYYQLSDANQDGLLSFSEMFSRRKSEYLFRYNTERRQLRSLLQQYPILPRADLAFLKRNPQLVVQLFENLVWMYEEEEMVEKLLKDGNWMQKNPRVMLALHKNLRWMAANPNRAKRLYQNRTYTQELPQLVGWRANHKKFIRNNALLDKFYEISFIPEGIRVQR